MDQFQVKGIGRVDSKAVESFMQKTENIGSNPRASQPFSLSYDQRAKKINETFYNPSVDSNADHMNLEDDNLHSSSEKSGTVLNNVEEPPSETKRPDDNDSVKKCDNISEEAEIICKGCGKKFQRLIAHLKCSSSCAVFHDLEELINKSKEKKKEQNKKSDQKIKGYKK